MKNSPPQKKGDAPSADAPPDESQNQSPNTALAVVTEVFPPIVQPVALAQMTIPMLAEAAMGLEHAENQYTKLSGICATLNGLVLQEIKGRLGHGQFGPWLKDNFSKSWKSAAQRMRLATEFVKFNPKVKFETLCSDLLTTLEHLDASQLDWNNPLVQDVSAWVNGRSTYQLLLAFPGNKGGDSRIPCPHCKKLVKADETRCPHCHGEITPYDPNSAVEEARDLLLHPLREIARLWHEKSDGAELWTHLPDAEREEIAGIFLDLGNDLKAARAEKKTVKKGGAK